MDKKHFYITTPIYFPNARLHIGHAYTTTAADAIARFKRIQGYDVMFLTGSDEHGQKIARIAKENGKAPKEYVDEIVVSFKELWRRLNISYDDFIRTTDERHKAGVAEVFNRLYKNGDIYKDEYEGWYCVPCETFWLERQLQDGKCPDCGRPVELLREEAYFFDLPKYQDRLLKHIHEHPEFILPETRKNEMLRFIEGGLEPLCVSRTTFDWGLPVPIDEKHVIYVWVDALSNYITALGFHEGSQKFQDFWPADVHLMAKEIVRFHSVIWPAILMALGFELPKTIFGHGWLVVEGDKMSKSKGNVVDPIALIDEFGEDPIRYFLLREIVFGQDGNFSRTALINRLNSDLANDLGNLLHRTGTMMGKYFQGIVPESLGDEPLDKELIEAAEAAAMGITEAMDKLELNIALQEIWKFINRTNKYIDEAAPWALAREGKQERLQSVMYNLAESLRFISVLIWPFIPGTGEEIWKRIGMDGTPDAIGFNQGTKWGGMKPGAKMEHGTPLFPRILEDEEPIEEEPAKEETPTISIDEFYEAELRIGEVLSAERVKGADRLLKLQVDIGDEKRQIVAGIARHYTPEEMKGRKVVIVANLKPAKIRGVESQGMLLAAVDGDALVLLTTDKEIRPGGKVQ
jgi:methionyl-tRNA synthetase